MIKFYPRDIGMWRKDFSFGTCELKRKFAEFHEMSEFFEWLTLYNVRLDDPEFPLKLKDYDHPIHGMVKSVIQWNLVGWIIICNENTS